MLESNALPHFSGVLLDVNGTFIFGEDRFGPDQDYYATYSNLGGQQLEPAAVRIAVLACYEHMSVIYEDPAGR